MSLVRVAGTTGLLLLIPLVAMQFTREVSWSVGDFLAAGALLFSAGCGIVRVNRRFERRRHRVWASAAIVLALAVVWAELAVGIFR
ncbi:hypothetical protein JI739_02875 [Ramlibacter sp. AW1]|uniref:Uncharacterized protein n=1 Tax=Ramlibacter aurantiacus TaxID=2801330 RepID=A0A936ZG61_9BURK|nr:hypothetical protein [Ramlibacter aurantiacus]MBL0419282.1 hypothetical protein [Ramlibacter aurantiacus]